MAGFFLSGVCDTLSGPRLAATLWEIDMQLLDTRGANPKLKKTGAAAPFRYAGLSLFPDAELCPGSKAAGCADTCLAEQGRGRFDNVRAARLRKADFLRSDRGAFLDQLHRELSNFEKLCERTGERGAEALSPRAPQCARPSLSPSLRADRVRFRARHDQAVQPQGGEGQGGVKWRILQPQDPSGADSHAEG